MKGSMTQQVQSDGVMEVTPHNKSYQLGKWAEEW